MISGTSTSSGDLVAAGHDGDHAVIAVEQLGKQARIFDFDGFRLSYLFTHSLQIQIYNGAKVTIFFIDIYFIFDRMLITLQAK